MEFILIGNKIDELDSLNFHIVWDNYSLHVLAFVVHLCRIEFLWILEYKANKLIMISLLNFFISNKKISQLLFKGKN